MLGLEPGKKLDLPLQVASQLLEDFEKTDLAESEADVDYIHFADGRKAGCSHSTADRTAGCTGCKPAARTEGRHYRIAAVDCSAGHIAEKSHILDIVDTADQVEMTEHPAGKYWRLE